MDQALDDIVPSRSRRGGGGGFRRNGGGPQRRRGGFGGGNAAFGHDDRTEGAFDDNRSGGGAFRRRGGRPQQRNNTPYARDRSAGSVDSLWTHDLYQDEEEEDFVEDEPVNTGGRRGLETGTKLQISNLAYSVLSEDLKDLFGSIGDVKRATVNFDKSGRSLGTATVVFSRRGDAVAAVKKYNGVPLDDSPMRITLLGNALGGGGGGANLFSNTFRAIHDEALTISVGAPRTRRIVAGGGGSVRGRRLTTGRTVGRVGGGGRGRGRGGRGGRSGFGRDNKKPVTAEELDAEMDAYNEEANE